MSRPARCLLFLLPAMALAAQAPPPDAQVAARGADLVAFAAWLDDYGAGAFRLVKDGATDEAALADVDARMAKVAAWNTLEAAKALFRAASIEPRPAGASSSTDLVDYFRELQPWRVQALAAKHLRAMTVDGLVPWLVSMLRAPGIRAQKQNQDQTNAAAVLRILAGHPSVEAQLELMRACRSMPTELRVQAVNAMAKDAALDLAPTLVELLRDAEPNVRIAAANALGTALQPHVDETLGKQPDAATLQLRDAAIQKLEELLVKDQVWQVRSAAAFALASMRCKPVVPALIRGLEAELNRKKDPWAMDVRLHKLLEGLTGQKVVRGSIAPWKAFWAAEGAAFTVRPKTAPGAAPAVADKYEKFFDLELESDRVLFVLDFSGSMAEPVQLQGRGTGAGAGTPTTKAALVVAELKKLILSLPDGAMVNMVVFSDEVRVWRQEGKRPALVKLTDDARDDLLGNFLDNLRPAGSTNLYGALDRALAFGDNGLYDKYYAAGFDTLYVITDGAPTAGEVTDKEEIRRRVRERNALRKIAIHCVTFGDKNDTDFLRPMAEENGGRHVHVE
ncbi:MAG: HEAT repeat domain-containing protein [Planctomycetes bacterium]|nr:HEAT repeat domain-containing protein [Planctomycetota bacterium]